ncbi:hypothetical protein TNCV_754991 [Trichonephila clavipes]|nr:hypothetical protein TNCV_754991 [Trichonephila clavipes]
MADLQFHRPQSPYGQGIRSWLVCHEFESSNTKDPPCKLNLTGDWILRSPYLETTILLVLARLVGGGVSSLRQGPMG